MTPPLPAGIVPGGRFAHWDPAPPAYVVCDVDGTLLGTSDAISAEVVAAVARAGAAGLRVGLATGRMRIATEALRRQLEVSGPHVLHNGAEVVDGTHVIAAWSLTAAQVDDLLALNRRLGDRAYLEVYTPTGYLVSAWDDRARPHWRILGREPDGVLTCAAELNGQVLPKATFALFDPEVQDELIDGVSRLGLLAGPAGSPLTPGLPYLNATHPDADKGRSLARAAAHLGVPMAATAAVGDADNDLSMLAVAGTAIAMGQAPDHVRAAAHLVVPDVDAHGAAVALDACIDWRQGR